MSQAEKWSSYAGVDLIQGQVHNACGQTYAQAVQMGLQEGETFEDMDAPSPEEAIGVVKEAKAEGLSGVASFWRGYLSRWD